MKPLFLQNWSNVKEFQDMVTDHQPRHKAYCEKWGYQYLADGDGEEFNGWGRIEMILRHLESGEYSHVFWVDADCFVAAFTYDMCSTVPEPYWLGLTIHPYPWQYDYWHLQTGMMYFRACDESIAFLKRVLEFKGEVMDEQVAIGLLMIAMPESERWQRGLRILSFQWNNTLHDQAHHPIVAAFHGIPERRQRMLEAVEWYPYPD